MPIDIVIPVYNAHEYLRECVESIFRCTPRGDYRVIAVNDCSTDPRVREYLLGLGDAIVYLENEINQGFVVTSNRGMRYSENDVVLLNSDTAVTPGWLDKLRRCAYLDDRTATVTPFSNSGTICSVPEFCRDNELPQGMDADEFARFLDHISVRRYPCLPTAVGFCMYIRRSVLREIGYLDETAYGRGYGEENDFSYRATQAGYLHRLCDDAFIYHKGSMSFGDSTKNESIARNIRTLEERYPREREETLRFCSHNPNGDLWDTIRLHLAFANGKRTILYALHMPVPYRPGDSTAGGTQKHVLDLAKELSARYNVLILWPEIDQGLCVIGLADSGVQEMFFTMRDGETIGALIGRVVGNLTRAFGIDLIHVQHLQNLSWEIFKSAHCVPRVFTAHDYYMICPKVNLLKDGACCWRSGEENTEQCAECLQGTGLSIGLWRERAHEALLGCDALVAPDPSVARIFQDVMPDLEFQIIGHGVTLPDAGDNQPPAHERFRVAFVGSLSEHKGSAVISRLLRLTGRDELEWHLFGEVVDKSLLELRDRAVFHGPYAGMEILSLLRSKGIDLVCFFPLWPETYSYILTECWAAGVPVLGVDIGAVGSRIRETGYGYLLPAGADAGTILRKIGEIAGDRAEYGRIRDRLTEYRPKTFAVMADEYARFYERLFRPKDSAQPFDAEMILEAASRAKQGTQTMGMAYGEGLDRVRGVLRRVLPGFLADRLLRGQYPFKKQIKRAAAWVVRAVRK